jgi:hypothetical protein
MAQKMACLGLRGTTRSRQDESKEVHEAGRIRRSSGGKGGHHVWWGGLIFRLLRAVMFSSVSCFNGLGSSLGGRHS